MSEDYLAHRVKRHSRSSEKPSVIRQSVLMSNDEVLSDSKTDGNPTAPNIEGMNNDDARALVRLVQCSSCSRPFKTPVTLPCGHSVCRECLPKPHLRLNISYPNTVDRRTGVSCPVARCHGEHPMGDVNGDVTLSKLMETVVVEVDRVRRLANVQTTLTVLPARADEQEKAPSGVSHTLYGGQLLATFTLAELNELPYDSTIVYQDALSTEGLALDNTLLESMRDAMIRELECQICYNTMLDPVTTPCGHTFCRRCLTRVLDHSVHCPACRRALRIPASLSQQKSNGRISALLQSLCPAVIAARAEAIVAEETTGMGELDVPLFVCTMSFPGMPTFLHIFEPRYRLMMRRALDSNQLFGMLIYNRSRAPQGQLGVTEFCEYGTMLRIKHMQVLHDGRSIIETKGLYRFRVVANGMRDGYHIGRVEKVEDVSLADEERFEAHEIRASTAATLSSLASLTTADGRPGEGEWTGESSATWMNENTNNFTSTNNNTEPPSLESMSTLQLFTRASDFVARMRANSAPWLHGRILDTYGLPPEDPATFPYWFASVLPIADEEKYLLLATTSIRQRLKMVVGWIRGLEGQKWYSGSNCIIL